MGGKDKKMKYLLISIALTFCSFANAQYISEADVITARQNEQKEKLEQFYSYPIGKTFWIEPNKDVPPLFRKVFYRSMEMKKIGSYPNILTFSDGFYPTSITSFVPLKYFDYGITSFYTDGPSRQHAYLIRFEDGQEAY